MAPEPEPAPPWPAAGDPGPCDEASWPDKDHDLVCGECTVLVNHFSSSYETCDGYCASIGRGCIGGGRGRGGLERDVLHGGSEPARLALLEPRR